MIKQDFYIANIIARHLSGEITPEESTQLEGWRREDSAHEDLFQKICSKENLKKHVEKGASFNTATGLAGSAKSVSGKAIIGNG